MKKYKIFIDGSAIHTSNQGGWSYIVVLNNEIIASNYGKTIVETTKAELSSLVKAMLWIKENNISGTRYEIELVTDYEIIKKWLEGDSKRILNREYWNIIEPILKEIINSGTKIKVKHIKSHQQNENDFYVKYNKIADKLAYKGANSLLIKPDKELIAIK